MKDEGEGDGGRQRGGKHAGDAEMPPENEGMFEADLRQPEQFSAE